MTQFQRPSSPSPFSPFNVGPTKNCRLVDRSQHLLAYIQPRISDFVFRRYCRFPNSLTIVRDRLQEHFRNRVPGYPRGWPPRSPDHSPCVFLWGCLKSRLYQTPPQNLRDLHNTITACQSPFIARGHGINEPCCVMESHVQSCIERNGAHIEG